MKIAVASGKGGTGKTLVATNLAETFRSRGHDVSYLDCDVEVPNGYLFLKPTDVSAQPVFVYAPHGIDRDRCTLCGRCVSACQFSAMALLPKQVVLFPELCHVCGACSYVCPHDAIMEEPREIGSIYTGDAHGILHRYGVLKTEETAMTTRLIDQVKQFQTTDITILDAPPGTTCPAVETIRNTDCVLLVADPTPFGLHDLALSVDMCRRLSVEPLILINRAEEGRSDIRGFCSNAGLRILEEIPYDPDIAAAFSEGHLIVSRYDEYRKLFQTLAQRLLTETPAQKPSRQDPCSAPLPAVIKNWEHANSADTHSSEITVISGKGGTGKTTLTAAFAFLAKTGTAVDCDVDASNLPIVLPPTILSRGGFSGGKRASIDQERCTLCQNCQRLCPFGAIERLSTEALRVNPLLCEGCALCQLACPEDAVQMVPCVNGEWFVSMTSVGPMAHARLGIAEENSGKLVTLNREHGQQLNADMRGAVLIDGSPGTGCPVAASLTGAAYAVIVSEPTVAGLHDFLRILELTRFLGVQSGLVINKSTINERQTEAMLTMARKENVDILGCVPFDRSAVDAQIHCQSVVEYAPNSQISHAIGRIWGEIRNRCPGPYTSGGLLRFDV